MNQGRLKEYINQKDINLIINPNVYKNMNQNKYINNDSKNLKIKNEHSKSPIRHKAEYKNVTESPLNSKKEYILYELSFI